MKKLYTLIFMLFIASTTYSQDCNIGNTDGSDPSFVIGSFIAHNLLGVNFTLSEVGVLQSLNMFGNNTIAQIQMAIYDDMGGAPNNLIAFSNITSLEVGLNSLPITPMELEPGDYWIMAIYDINGNHSNVNQNASSSLVYYIPQAFGSPIPTNASGFISYTGQDFLYYAEVSCGPLSVNELERNSISISPNPASDYIVIGNIKEDMLFEIYDLTGKKLIEKNLSMSENQIDISQLAAGTYLINNGLTSVSRFLKN
ncbi:T9SS type A sorting domain-containing protein [Aequorivita marina]|uniref:T9SS type A sorting domain-containing protein n=1 Tax=Aequorivita marina TaxID=3073654 RepID=UPI002875B29A|nr:T9SS type A sorting domain-containing protein [Aequorivita sp. S2608]MDS1297618.1 T9SS type A sorting domain-containing protein [Aequorivita sp. S2608]